MNLTHVMIDLETLGTGPNAAIASIGAVLFDPDAGLIGELVTEIFYRTIDLDNSNRPGNITPSTVLWWLQQGEEARKELVEGGPRRRLGSALFEFEEWLKSKGVDAYKGTFWANDPDFDLVILANAYRRYNLKAPWSFRRARSMRTMLMLNNKFDLIGDYTDRGPEPVHHDSLDDAIYQAKGVIEIMQALKQRIGS